MHVTHGIEMDQTADPRHDQNHDRREGIYPESYVDVEGA